MKNQEKKYEVDSFNTILDQIKVMGLTKIKDVASEHYYGKKEGNDVEKFVVYSDRVEVHVWKNIDGRFIPTEDYQIESKEKGLLWLKQRGFTQVNIVTMNYTEYQYQDGSIGLYTIDDFHHSAILNLPAGEHQNAEKVFNLENSKIITVPYNKLLQSMGKLRTIKLN